MPQFTKKDFWFSIITGFYTGFIAWRIIVFLNGPEIVGISVAWLLVIVPVFWVIGVNLGYFLGRWWTFFNQFGKFAAIGFTNAAVDFGILNLLIASTGLAVGIAFSAFKAVSFVAATLHSYLWNKYWTFDSGQSHGGESEFFKFFGVTMVALIVNVGLASLIVNLIDPLFGFDQKLWANVGAVAGSAAALFFSFIGFKLVVFKK